MRWAPNISPLILHVNFGTGIGHAHLRDASVAEIARAHGVNANQVFKWRRLFEKGQLGDAGPTARALLPVTISADVETRPEPTDATADGQMCSGGAIHIELPGRAMISVESGADSALVRCVLESLRK